LRRDAAAPPGKPPASVRAIAARALSRVLRSRAPADAILARKAAGLAGRDRRLLAELVYGALRWLRRLDHVIERAASRPLAGIDPALLDTLRVGAVQLLALERIPAHAAVSEAVEATRRERGRGAAGFVNAVLRRVAEAPRFDDWPVELADPVARLAVESSHPDELVRRWWRLYGEERTRTIVAADNAQRRLHLLAFEDRGGRTALAAALAAEGIATSPSALSPQGLLTGDREVLECEAYRQGLFYVQDEASQAAALVPPPVPDESVLDAAAAPGGKGLALVAAEPRVRVVFADRSLPRLRRLDQNLARLGRRAPRVVADAGEPPWRAAFDRVIVDAPCTGTGTLRRHPELRWRFSMAELARLASESAPRLAAAAAAVAAGGRLVLVTCSIEPEENEEVVERVLAGHAALRRERIDPLQVPASAVAELDRGLWRILPAADHDGFSVHVLHKNR
jgi:16S rRNA (cytosine967-C5)-methyltransferase